MLTMSSSSSGENGVPLTEMRLEPLAEEGGLLYPVWPSSFQDIGLGFGIHNAVVIIVTVIIQPLQMSCYPSVNGIIPASFVTAVSLPNHSSR
jgi:hypothetical protein